MTFRHLMAVWIVGALAIFLVFPLARTMVVGMFSFSIASAGVADSDRIRGCVIGQGGSRRLAWSRALPIPIDAADAGGYNSPRSWSVTLGEAKDDPLPAW